jgi:hypothetical protein
MAQRRSPSLALAIFAPQSILFRKGRLTLTLIPVRENSLENVASGDGRIEGERYSPRDSFQFNGPKSAPPLDLLAAINSSWNRQFEYPSLQRGVHSNRSPEMAGCCIRSCSLLASGSGTAVRAQSATCSPQEDPSRPGTMSTSYPARSPLHQAA